MLLITTSYAVDVIYLDFKKAFDSVPHQRLLGKMKSYGEGNIFKWLSNFLHNRLQRVVVMVPVPMHWTQVKSGVPQGSILGPLLLFYDLPDNINVTCGIKLFADNTKIYSIIMHARTLLTSSFYNRTYINMVN